MERNICGEFVEFLNHRFFAIPKCRHCDFTKPLTVVAARHAESMDAVELRVQVHCHGRTETREAMFRSMDIELDPGKVMDRLRSEFGEWFDRSDRVL